MNPASAIVADFIRFKVDQRIGTTSKLKATLESTYRFYTSGTRDSLQFSYFLLNAEVSYSFNQWLKSSLRYDFKMRDINKGNVDYNVNRVMLGLSVGY